MQLCLVNGDAASSPRVGIRIEMFQTLLQFFSPKKGEYYARYIFND